jgi:very-short-patch-repair endonuclease
MNRNTHSSPPPLRGRSDREAVREGGSEKAAHRAVSPVHRGRAKTLRHQMTDADTRLWSALRAHRLDGLSFRRQTPVGRFIVDFVCHDRWLIVELDGGQHAESTKDIGRDRWLASKGYRVLRFWNSYVLKNRMGVLETILDAAHEATPLPNPPPQGGRGHARARGESAP